MGNKAQIKQLELKNAYSQIINKKNATRPEMTADLKMKKVVALYNGDAKSLKFLQADKELFSKQADYSLPGTEVPARSVVAC